MWAGALYYPYMRVRDKDWLKATVLYWDSMRRFQPRDYNLRESADCMRLIEVGYLRSLQPEPYAAQVNHDLLRFMRRNAETLRQRFSIYESQATEAGPGWGTEGPAAHKGLGWIHASKMAPQFSDFLANEGLGIIGRGEDNQWVGLHPTVAAAYMLALVGVCADRDKLNPVTDNPDPLLSPTHGVAAAMRLLTNNSLEVDHSSEPVASTTGFAMLAIQSVMPRDLSRIGIEQIIDIKSQLDEELASFRAYVASQQPELQRLAGINNGDVHAEAFAAHVNSEITRPLKNLERGLTQLGFDTVRSLLTLQTLAPPAIVAAVADQTHAPPAVAVVGAVGTVIGSAWWQLATDQKRLLHESPVGYLLSVKRALKPRTAVGRKAALLARA